MILLGSYICTQRVHWSSFEAFIVETYVQLVATKLCATLLVDVYQSSARVQLLLALYCVVLYIAACVGISRMVFWDHSVLHLPGKSFDTRSKAVKQF